MNPQKIQAVRRLLPAWYRKNARDLPWRNTTDPYKIWISEIMLQQTQVDTVRPYYERFIKAFPTVERLAAAGQDRVLKLWEGLGYYSRARNAHRTARIIVTDYKSEFPASSQELRRLPGIGRYTAGAIASIAFGIRAPVLDGNVKRVLSRLYAIDEEIERNATIARLWSIAESLVPLRSPGDFNQALMELGARVCIPQNPLCDGCPVRRWCDAHNAGVQNDLPVKRQRHVVPHAVVVAAAIWKNGRYLLGKRPENGMLGGLWEFPGGKVEPGESLQEALVREIREELGIAIEVRESIATVDHVYSHLSVTLHLFACKQLSGRAKPLYHSEIKWVLPSQFDHLAFPKANLKFIDILQKM